MRVAAPADKRFRRARVTPARRSRFLQFTWIKAARAAVLLALGLYGVYHVTVLVLNAQALTITRISVSGNSRMSRGEVVALLDGLRGTNMVTADLESWRQKLLGSPWVAEAAIRRVLPGTVAVAISERQPMGIGRVGNDLYLIDDRGGIIDQFGPNYAEFDLPIIDGLAAPPRDNGPLIDEVRAGFAAHVLASLQAHPNLAKRVSELDVPTRATLFCSSKVIRRSFGWATSSSPNGCSRTSISLRLSANGLPGSITWTCASMSACTSDLRPPDRGRSQAVGNPVRRTSGASLPNYSQAATLFRPAVRARRPVVTLTQSVRTVR